MWDLEWLRERAARMGQERRADITDSKLSQLSSAEGPAAALEARHDAWFSMSNETFRAGLFKDAAEAFAERQAATRELAALLKDEGDEDGAKEQREELARHAWADGDLKLFERYVREGCDPAGKAKPRLDVYPALFMSWAVVSRLFHPEHWRARLEEAIDGERRVLRQRWEADQLLTAERVVIECRKAEASYWLGNFTTALEEARNSLLGFKAWRRTRPEGMKLSHKRVWRNRMQGLVSLLEGRDDETQLPKAIDAFTRALVDSVLAHDVDWKDLVILHVTARAWADPEDSTVVEFKEAFPHLVHLLAKERTWKTDS